VIKSKTKASIHVDARRVTQALNAPHPSIYHPLLYCILHSYPANLSHVMFLHWEKQKSFIRFFVMY